MFSQKQHYFSRYTKTYPLLKLVDVYDKHSFIREYVLDNVFVCIFMYILFYFAIWYAHKVIKRIERKNREMLATVERNRSRLKDIIALKNKRNEYEEIVIKAKGAQKITTKQLDIEIKRLSSELGSTMSKLRELEKFLGKILFSGNFGRIAPSDRQKSFRSSKESHPREPKLWRTQSRTSRYSSHRSHRRCHRSRRRASSASLHDHPQRRALRLRKSDSSNRASAETSSTESSCQAFQSLPKYHAGQGDRKKYHYPRRSFSSGKFSNYYGNVKKFPSERQRASTAPFSRSTVNLAPML